MPTNPKYFRSREPNTPPTWGSKRCRGACKEIKFLSEFPKEPRNKDGRRGDCKACHSRKNVLSRIYNHEMTVNPEHYYECHDCRRIFKYSGKAFQRNNGVWVYPKVLEGCKYCKSKNIEVMG